MVTVNVNPSDILFSLPTINNVIPVGDGCVADALCPRIHEDDWRQFEFIRAVHREAVDRELDAVGRVWAEAGVPVGGGHAFRRLHVRSALPVPLDLPWTAPALAAMYATTYTPLAFLDQTDVLAGVATVLVDDGLLVYAQFDAGRVIAMGLHPRGPVALPAAIADPVEAFVRRHQLMLVHWPSRTLFNGPDAAMRYLRGPVG